MNINPSSVTSGNCNVCGASLSFAASGLQGLVLGATTQPLSSSRGAAQEPIPNVSSAHTKGWLHTHGKLCLITLIERTCQQLRLPAVASVVALPQRLQQQSMRPQCLPEP